MNDRQTLTDQAEKQSSNQVDFYSPITATRGDRYEIKVVGHLDEQWSAWLGGLEITHLREGTTLLSGLIPDQAALYGILIHIRDMGQQLLSLKRLEELENRGHDCGDLT